MIGNLLWPIILQIAGILVVMAEFIVPSMGILTVASIAVFGYSLFLVFANVSFSTGIIFLIFDILLIPIILFIGMKFLAASPATLKTSLSSKDGSVSQPPEWLEIQGKTGEAITDLHPAGTAVINGKRYDVVSRGEYIEKGTSILVVTVDGNRIVVKNNTPNNKVSEGGL